MPNRPSMPPAPDKGDFKKLSQDMEALTGNFSDFQKKFGTHGGAPIPEESTISLSPLTKAINELNKAVRYSATQVAAVGKATGAHAKAIAGEAYAKTKEQINVDKGGYTARAVGSLAGPVGGIIAQNIVETKAWQDLQRSIKEGTKRAGKAVWEKAKSIRLHKRKSQNIDEILSETGEERTRFHSTEPMLSKKSMNAALGKAIPASMTSPGSTYRRSPNPTIAIDRLRIAITGGPIGKGKGGSANISSFQDLPKAAKGGVVNKGGAAIVHKGEAIIPKEYLRRNIELLSEIYSTLQEQSSALTEMKDFFADPSAGGGFFKMMGSGLQLMFPLFSGGLYKNDIQKSSNPLITIASGILEQYRWQRLYGELTKRQLNELIKMQGGELQDVYGKRGIFFEFFAKNRKKIYHMLRGSIAKDEQKESRTKFDKFKTGAKKMAAGAIGGMIGSVLAMDPEMFAIKYRENAMAQAQAMLESPEIKKAGLAAAIKKSTIFGMVEGQAKGKGRWEAQMGPESIPSYMSEERGEVSKPGTRRERTAQLKKQIEADLALEQKVKEDYERRMGKKTLAAKRLLARKEARGEKISGFLSRMAGREVHDYTGAKGYIKNLVSKTGEIINLHKDDMVKAAKGGKDKTQQVLLGIWDTLKGSKKIQIESASTLTETQKFIQRTDEREEKQEKQAEKEKKRAGVWESIKGKSLKVKGGIEKFLNVISAVAGALVGVIPLLVLMAANPKRAIAAIKWTFSAPMNFAKMMYMYFGKFAKLFNPKFMWGAMKTVWQLPKFFRSIFKFVGVFAKMFQTGGFKLAGKYAGKVGAKIGGKMTAKALGKIPVIGHILSPIMGFLFGINRFRKGDIVGGVGEIGSGLAMLLDLVAPGVGTVVSLLLDGLLIARDLKLAKGGGKEQKYKKSGNAVADFFGEALTMIKNFILAIPKALWSLVKKIVNLNIKYTKWVFTKAIPGIFSGIVKTIAWIIRNGIKIFFKTITAVFIKFPFWLAKMTIRVVKNMMVGLFHLWKWLYVELPRKIIKSTLSFIKKLFTKQFWMDVFSFVKKAAETAIKVITFIPKMLAKMWTKMLRTLWEAMKGIGKTIWEGIKGMGRAIIDGIVGIIKELIPNWAGKIKNPFNKTPEQKAKQYSEVLGSKITSDQAEQLSKGGTGMFKTGKGTAESLAKQMDKRNLSAAAKRREISNIATLFKMYGKTDQDNKLIRNLIDRGASSAEIFSVMKQRVIDETIAKKKKDASKLIALVKDYGTESVYALYNKLGDADLVEKILKGGKATKGTEGVRIVRLMQKLPEKQKEIADLAAKGATADDLEKLFAKDIKELPIRRSVEQLTGLIEENAKLLEDTKKAKDVLVEKKRTSKLNTEETKLLSDYEDKVSSLEEERSALETELGQSKTDIVNTGSPLGKMGVEVTNLRNQQKVYGELQRQEEGARAQRDIHGGLFSGDKARALSNLIERYPQYTQDIKRQHITGVDINTIAKWAKQGKLIKNVTSGTTLGSNINSAVTDATKAGGSSAWYTGGKNAPPAKAVMDWGGKAKAIVTVDGQTVIPNPADVVTATKEEATRVGTTAKENVVSAPKRFWRGLVQAARNVRGQDVEDVFKGRMGAEDLAKRVLKAGVDPALNPLKQSAADIKAIPGHAISRVEQYPKDVARGIENMKNQQISKLRNTTAGQVYDTKGNVLVPKVEVLGRSPINPDFKLPPETPPSQKPPGPIYPGPGPEKEPGPIYPGAPGKLSQAISGIKENISSKLNSDSIKQTLLSKVNTEQVQKLTSNKLVQRLAKEANINPARLESTIQNAVAKQNNESYPAVKSAETMGKKVEDSTKAAMVAMSQANQTFNETSNTSINNGGGGGDQPAQPFWRSIDSILSGNEV
jgi:hypothetical protein